MFEYTIVFLPAPKNERFVSRSDGLAIGLDMANRDMRLFIYEWINGAITVNQNGAPRPYTLARLHQISALLQPVLDWPEGT